jgi:hypothetical protein
MQMPAHSAIGRVGFALMQIKAICAADIAGAEKRRAGVAPGATHPAAADRIPATQVVLAYCKDT